MMKHLSAALLGTLVTVAALAQAQAATTDAEVRRVDKSTGKITLKHGEIKNLDMPPMTMVFGVKDKALLDKVKAGDKVKFTADKAPDGQYLVTSIEAQK
jgi:Cu(I)/Ag(I) efflux system protein CusF